MSNLPPSWKLESILALAVAATCAAQVRYEDILHGPADNWLTYAGDYHGRPRDPGADVDTCFSGRIAVTLLRLG